MAKTQSFDLERFGEKHRKARNQNQEATLHHLIQAAETGGIEIEA